MMLGAEYIKNCFDSNFPVLTVDAPDCRAGDSRCVFNVAFLSMTRHVRDNAKVRDKATQTPMKDSSIYQRL